MMDSVFDTVAYCIMPTHFHFLIRVKVEDTTQINPKIGTMLSSYTKAINHAYNRHGSLFQQHSKSKYVDDEEYLATLVTYIHQNPLRANLVKRPEDWLYSSYQDYIDLRKGTLPKKEIILDHFPSVEEFKKFSEVLIEHVREKYWV
jgi:REP element-mobilizing transposase RayT